MKNHITDDLKMHTLIKYLDYFMKFVQVKLSGIAGPYVNDLVVAVDGAFVELSKVNGRTFTAKAREFDSSMSAEVDVKKESQIHLLHHYIYTNKLQRLPIDYTFTNFRSRRHKLLVSHTPNEMLGSRNTFPDHRE